MRESFLNTEAWAEFQRSIGHPTWRFNNGKIAANVVRHDVGFGRCYLYVPHGPTLDLNAMQAIKNELAQFSWFLRRLANEQRAMFVKLEPQSDAVAELLMSSGLRLKRSRKQIQPSHSVVLDLTLSDDELLGQMHHKTRYNVQLAERKGLQFDESTNLDAFWKLLRETAATDQFSLHPRTFYEQLLALEGDELKTKLFIVSTDEGIPVAGMVLLRSGDTAYYLHGASDREHRSLMAPYFMHWQAMHWAHEHGALRYDFWGIDADRWPGVTRFKLSFGGHEVEHPGAFDLVTSRFWYFLYNLARKLTGRH